MRLIEVLAAWSVASVVFTLILGNLVNRNSRQTREQRCPKALKTPGHQ